MLGFTSLPVPLATAAIILRFWLRVSARRLGADDWCMLAAFVFYLGMYSCLVFAVVKGGSLWPMDLLSEAQVEAFGKARPNLIAARSQN